MKKNMLLSLVCALLLCASVVKADDYYAIHELSASSDTFWITKEIDRTFSFTVGYVLNNLLESMEDFNFELPLNISFDKDLFTAVIAPIHSRNLLPGDGTWETADGNFIGWNNGGGNFYEGGDLFMATFTLKDSVSLDVPLTSTEITFGLGSNFSLPDIFGFDAPSVTVWYGTIYDNGGGDDDDRSDTPEPATLLILGISAVGAGFAARRRMMKG